MIQDDFHRWMIHSDRLKPSTADSYVYSVQKLAEHYSMQVGRRVDFYNINDVDKMSKISFKYRKGIYRDIGYKDHGTNAAAIQKYVDFLHCLQHKNTNTSPPRGPAPDPQFWKLHQELNASKEQIAQLRREADRLRETVHRLIAERDAARTRVERLQRELQQSGASAGTPRNLRLKIANLHPDKYPMATEFERTLRGQIFAELWSEVDRVERADR